LVPLRHPNSAVVCSARCRAAITELRTITAGLACALAALRNTRITLERSGLLADTARTNSVERRVSAPPRPMAIRE
jgi:hypothetical protein